MATLEKRISDLEAHIKPDEKPFRMLFLKDGQTSEQVLLEAGIPVDYAGWVVCVAFVVAQHTQA
jgi:hypothetical protein